MNADLADMIGNSIVRMKTRIDNSHIHDLFEEYSAFYVQHFLKSMKMAIKLGFASFQLIFNAYFPCMCKKTRERIIAELQDDNADE